MWEAKLTRQSPEKWKFASRTYVDFSIADFDIAAFQSVRHPEWSEPMEWAPGSVEKSWAGVWTSHHVCPSCSSKLLSRCAEIRRLTVAHQDKVLTELRLRQTICLSYFFHVSPPTGAVYATTGGFCLCPGTKQPLPLCRWVDRCFLSHGRRRARFCALHLRSVADCCVVSLKTSWKKGICSANAAISAASLRKECTFSVSSVYKVCPLMSSVEWRRKQSTKMLPNQIILV